MVELTMVIADIPLFFALTFRIIQQIASVYGYDPEDEKKIVYYKINVFWKCYGASRKTINTS